MQGYLNLKGYGEFAHEKLVVDLCAFAGAAVVHIVIAADSDENAS